MPPLAITLSVGIIGFGVVSLALFMRRWEERNAPRRPRRSDSSDTSSGGDSGLLDALVCGDGDGGGDGD